MPAAMALGLESLSSLQEDEPHQGLQGVLSKKFQNEIVRFAFFCAPAAL
jgi:hypothetical protein